MKNTRIASIIALALAFIVAMPAILIAGDEDEAAVTQLTTGLWRFTGGTWSNVRIFYDDGTAINVNDENTGPIRWKISGGKIIIQFTGYQESLDLPLDPAGTKGTDRDGKAFTAAKVKTHPAAAAGKTTPAPIASPEMREKAAALVKASHDSLLMINGSGGRGSAFVATISGTNFIVTNAHVICKARNPVFKDLDNNVIPSGDASVASGADLMLLQAGAGKPLEVMRNVDEGASIGDDVVVLGNAEGEGVVNTIMGKIVGIGPNLVEIDAPMVSGNSGSPIVHLKSGKVIGVASYVSYKKYDAATRELLKQPEIRRFGYRLDFVKTWQPVSWPTFYAQADAVAKLQPLTTDLSILCDDLTENGTNIPAGRHTNPLLRDHVDAWLRDKAKHVESSDALRTDQMFVSFLKSVSQSDINALRPRLTYDFFQHRLAETLQLRAIQVRAMEKIILHEQ